ncbi:hypothetical protein [Streptomyces sp. WAC 01325]|uniref:hypothetical protein n=1 Tax=Streptomyces sp. WAC 01325 TaxID=2203202 RepID=UPI000F87FE7A|nr:hypothetical protein [Streptomyces sp. WAC 01325]
MSSMEKRIRKIAVFAALGVTLTAATAVASFAGSDDGGASRTSEDAAIRNADMEPQGFLNFCTEPNSGAFNSADCTTIAAADATASDVEVKLGSTFKNSITSIRNQTDRNFCFFTATGFGASSISLPPGGSFLNLADRAVPGAPAESSEKGGPPEPAIIKYDDAIASFKDCQSPATPQASASSAASPSTSAPASSAPASPAASESSTAPADSEEHCDTFEEGWEHEICDSVNGALDRDERIKKCPDDSVCLWEKEGFRGAIYIYHLDRNFDRYKPFEPFRFPGNKFTDSDVELNDNAKSMVSKAFERCVQVFVDVDAPKDRISNQHIQTLKPGVAIDKLDPGYSEIRVSKRLPEHLMCESYWLD